MTAKDEKPRKSWWCGTAARDNYRGGLGYLEKMHESCQMKLSCACRCHDADKKDVA